MGNRGLRASMGAGLSLVVAGVLALALFGTLVAFEGLPFRAPSHQLADVRLPDVPPPVEDSFTIPPAGAAVVAGARADRRRSARRMRAAAPDRQRTQGRFVSREPARERAVALPSPVSAAPVEVVAEEEVPAPPTSRVDALDGVTRQVDEVLDPVTRAAEDVTEEVTGLAEPLLGP
jgi:hypothetical protein